MGRKLFSLALVMVITLSFLTGCSKTNSQTPSNKVTGKKIKVTLLGAQFGDKSYWDSSKRGIETAGEKFKDKIEINVVDMTPDRTKWKDALVEASEGDSDLIITGTWDQEENLEEIASQYPDKKYILFDSPVDYEKYDCKNVYSMGYKANESGYLAGLVGAYMTESKNEGINPEKTIGFVGGMDNTPIINDFLVGYIEGAKSIEPNIKVAVSYIGSFTDSAKAKELALAQFNSRNVDIIFSVAGASGTGTIEAAGEVGKYAIGVDSDQSALYEGRKEQSVIVTSALKRVDNSILNSISKYLDGTLPFGKYEVLGINDDAIGIVKNDIFKGLVDSDFISKIEKAEQQLKNGEIKVTSAFDIDQEQVKKMVNSVQ